MKVRDVIKALEQFAPLPLQEGWDNAGLQVGLTEADVSGALLCLDVTPQVIDEAIASGCNLVVSHHPLIFHKLSCVSDADMVQRAVMKAVKHDVAVVSMHTNMDNAKGGVNYKMAEKLHLSDVRLLAAKTVGDVECGSGVIGSFASPMAADDFVKVLKDTFAVECVECNQLLRRPISTVALCGGAGAFLLQEAMSCGVDAFVTGEMHYHEFFGLEQKIQIAVIGHYQSEQYTTEIFKSIIEEKCYGVRCRISSVNTNPIIYF